MLRDMLLVVGVVALVAVTASGQGENAIAPEQEMALFNGKDLNGWVVHLKGDAPAEETFYVKDGVIHCTGKPAGYMRTVKAYRDYKLTVEWRYTRPGNSGILMHVTGPDRVWPKSIECQGMFRNQGDFYLIGGTECNEHKGMSGTRVPKRGEHNEKPAGEWNIYEIVCKGDIIQPRVNGKLMNEATGCTVTEGMIAIQSEGGAWECRKITIAPPPRDIESH